MKTNKRRRQLKWRRIREVCVSACIAAAFWTFIYSIALFLFTDFNPTTAMKVCGVLELGIGTALYITII